MGRMLVLGACGALALATACSESVAPTQRPPDAVDVTIRFCNQPAWFALRNDGYAWRIVPTTSPLYRLAVTPRVAIAWGVSSANPASTRVNVIYLTADELKTLMCGHPSGSNFVWAPVAGVDSAHTVVAQMSGAPGTYVPTPASSGSVLFAAAPAEAADVLAYTAESATGRMERFILRHGVVAGGGSSLATLDFDAAEAVSADSMVIVAPGATATSVSLFTSRGASVDLAAVPIDTDSSLVHGPPTSILSAGDAFVATARTANQLAAQYFATTATQVLSFGPALTTPTVTTVWTQPSLILRAAVARQPEYPSLASITYLQAASSRWFTIAMTSAYVGSTLASWTLEMPDLGPVLDQNWLLMPNATTAWSASAWNTRIGLYFEPLLGGLDGEVVRCATAESGLPSAGCSSGMP